LRRIVDDMQMTLNGLFIPTTIDYNQAKKTMLTEFKSAPHPTDEEKAEVESYRIRTWRKLHSNEKPPLLTAAIMHDLDKIFQRSFRHDDNNTLDPKLLIGTHHSLYLDRFKHYRTNIVSYLRDVIIDKDHADDDANKVADNLLMKLGWALRGDHPGRPPMPLYTCSAVMAVAYGLKMTPEAIKEVSIHLIRFIDIICLGLLLLIAC